MYEKGVSSADEKIARNGNNKLRSFILQVFYIVTSGKSYKVVEKQFKIAERQDTCFFKGN